MAANANAQTAAAVPGLDVIAARHERRPPDSSRSVYFTATRHVPLPDGLDVGELPVVDISIEPYDGDLSHSGDSDVRGTLTDA